MSNLTLNGSIPGLLRRGSPVSWRDEETPYAVTIAYADAVLAGPASTPCIGVEDDPSNFTLDLADPTGLLHALLWLEERGHDLWWARKHGHAAEIVAWSVVSVGRGGKTLSGVFLPWADGTDKNDAYYEWGYMKEWRDLLHGGFAYCTCSVYSPRTAQVLRWGMRGWGLGWAVSVRGPETGAEGRAAADRACLSAGYALTGEDGALTLPPLPEP